MDTISREQFNPLEAHSDSPCENQEKEDDPAEKNMEKSISLDESQCTLQTSDAKTHSKEGLSKDVTDKTEETTSTFDISEKDKEDLSNSKVCEKDKSKSIVAKTVNSSKNQISEDIDTEGTLYNAEIHENDNCKVLKKLDDNTDSTQVAVTELNAASSKKLITAYTDDAECSSKGVIEKSVIELENTEFVQFSQDKHGDSHIENQAIEAEDPFGGDNLTSESMEQIETEDITEHSVSFSKLCDQGGNLQDIVALPSEGHTDKTIHDNVQQFPSTSQNIESTQNSVHVCTDNNDHNVGQIDEKTNSAIVTKANINCNQQKDVDEVTPMETEEEQSNVLPGQDDELCIIPDSMKVIIPGQSVEKAVSNIDNSMPESNCVNDTLIPCPQSKNANSDTNKNCPRDHIQAIIMEGVTCTNRIEIVEKEHIAPNKNTTAMADIINIDEESKNSEIEEIATKEICKQCNEQRSCKIKVKIGLDSYNVCSKTCKALFKAANNKATDIPSDAVNSKREKRCANCLLIVELNDERNLSWETMEFCNEECLGKFQTKYGSYCRNCNGCVQAVSLGKYCVRFGYDVRQFCCSTCLEEFKKGLKVCSYCQKDISSSMEGFLAPVGDKGQFKDFCTQQCMEKYSKMSSAEPPKIEKKCCSVCQEEKIVHCEVQIDRSSPVAICSEPCFAAFKFVKKVDPEQCSTCKKFFELPSKKSFVVFYENEAHTFCTKTCLNIFIITNRKIVPCNWCKVKKYNFDMIQKELKTGQTMMMCSLNCLTLYQVSINAVSAKRINCDFCKEFSQAQYHLTMSDATIRNFCSYNCVMNFQAQYTKSPITIPSSDDPVPTGIPKRTIPQRAVNQTVQQVNELQNAKNMPVISSVTSLATIGNGQTSPPLQQNNINNVLMSANTAVQNQSPQIIYKQQIITRPPSPVKIHNKTTQCKPVMHTKDPFEAELLMMAEMVATEKKANESDSDSADDRDDDPGDRDNSHSGGFSPEGVDSSNTFGDDMLQMALKMATGELDEPAVDLEAALTPNTITATQAPAQTETTIDNDVQPDRIMAGSRGRKRMVPYKPRSTPNKRARRVSGAHDMPLMPPPEPQPPPQPRIMEPIEKPDANMALKYTFGVNAWRQWVVAKNAELEKQSTPMRKMKLFKTDLLQLTADELNYSLCLFVKEVRKPNGAEYAPDTIYYLCLGIQQYLFENNRIDNIFTDSYYEKFTDCLNEVAKKFSLLYNDAQYIVTRVEEEHLWECKQLGAHSPHVLLSTLMFFNTKHFNLVTVEEHMQLSFSHIMKHWKRNPAAQPTAVAGKVPGSRNVLLRFYPPQSALEANSRKKKVYEQQENEENPLRCPVKLYEFYLSKCPESVKTRNDVFYLLPERSCVPDSPVWYSTSPLGKEHLIKMLYRVKMVKEINVALLTS
ncbi:hypothetical protein KM043_014400 [Ampulex compressa]|nr:hypothetical protein KM043_014400 [Ampulex compressa]